MVAKRNPTLAKLTPPRLLDALQRKRLFTFSYGLQIARHLTSGPPGAGKTTLIPSDLEARNVPIIWYQVAARNANPAAFCSYLIMAMDDSRTAREDLTLKCTFRLIMNCWP